MRKLLSMIAAGLVCVASPVSAQESQAESWGLLGEQALRFEGKVTDLLCAITGNCPADCGAGKRQLGLLRDDGSLVVVGKNVQAAFNGAVPDMLPFCGQRVEVDGLMVGEGATKLYQVQLVRPAGSDAVFEKTTRWTDVWAASHPDLAATGDPWFRKDPRVLSRIKAEGYLGLGLEVDRKFIAEW
jgi:hypothetical protein